MPQRKISTIIFFNPNGKSNWLGYSITQKPYLQQYWNSLNTKLIPLKIKQKHLISVKPFLICKRFYC